MILEKPLLIETSKGFSIKYRNRHLYSKYDPINHILKTINSLNLTDKTLYLVPSPLLGYGLRELENIISKDSLIIYIEIDLELYNLSYNREDIYQVNSGFRFLEILNTIDFSKYNKCQLIPLNGSYSLYKNQYDKLYNILLNHLHNYWKNRYTMTKLGQLWIKNTLINLKTIDSAQPLSNLKVNKPVVVIGAGESTESVLPLLMGNRDDVYILCVDTALQILLEANIYPDAVVALEGQFYNLPDFYGAKNIEIDLIYDLSSYPKVLPNIKGRKFYTITQYTESTLLEKIKLAFSDNSIPPLGSVGITAIYIALEITSCNIYLAGLDFSYKLGKTHSKGSPYHLNSLVSWNRIFQGDSFINCLKRPILNKFNKQNQLENSDSILYEYSLYAKELLFGSSRVYDLTNTGMELGVPIISNSEFSTQIQNIDLPIKSIKESIANELIDCKLWEEVYKDIVNAISICKDYFNEKTTMDNVKINLDKVDYLFDYFPEVKPLKILSKHNLNRFYITLIRYKRLLGL